MQPFVEGANSDLPLAEVHGRPCWDEVTEGFGLGVKKADSIDGSVFY